MTKCWRVLSLQTFSSFSFSLSKKMSTNLLSPTKSLKWCHHPKNPLKNGLSWCCYHPPSTPPRLPRNVRSVPGCNQDRRDASEGCWFVPRWKGGGFAATKISGRLFRWVLSLVLMLWAPIFLAENKMGNLSYKPITGSGGPPGCFF